MIFKYICIKQDKIYQMPFGKLLLKIESSQMSRWYIYSSFI